MNTQTHMTPETIKVGGEYLLPVAAIYDNRKKQEINAIGQDSDVGQIAPWRSVTNDDICSILEGTLLGEMTNLYSCVTKPKLPLEAALLKAIVTAGCALSGPKPKIQQSGNAANTQGKTPLLPPKGILNARLRINTAGGQACNVYAILAANSSSGKDIGNLLDLITDAKGWLIGNAGSAEGLAEALITQPNGLISISEFMNWLDEKHWQHKATSFLTDAFNKGFFKQIFSSRGGKSAIRESDYCYPNIIANIQPDIFESIVSTNDISSGFFGRFLMAKMPEFYGNPAKFDSQKIHQRFYEILGIFEATCGVVDFPEDYGVALSSMFKKYSPEKLAPSWRRLTNEYMPRLATMLSITNNIGNLKISDRNLEKAEKMVQWFFSQAETMLLTIENRDHKEQKQYRVMKRIIRIIAKKPGVTLREISQSMSGWSTSEERRKAILEMRETSWIKTDSDKPAIDGAKFCIDNMNIIPPGMLEKNNG